MKEMLKRVISIIICFSMMVVPVISVGAEGELISITEDLTTATSVDGWKVSTTGNSTAGLVPGEGYKIDQKTEADTTSTKASVVVSKVFDNKVVDDVNKTVAYTEKFQGKYRLKFDFSIVNGSTTPFYTMIIGAYDKESGTLTKSTELRIRSNACQAVDASKYNYAYSAESDPVKHSVELVIDTVAKTYSISIDGKLKAASRELVATSLDYINAIRVSNMKSMTEDSYFTLEKIVFEEVESDYNAASEATKAVLASLPEKFDVTEETITLTQANGVIWTSSDENVINSTTGAVTRGEEDKTVTVTAEVDLNNNGGVYTKEYTMTVPKLEGQGGTGGGESGDDDEEDVPVTGKLISIEEDFAKYTSLDVIPNTSVSTVSNPVTTKVGIGTNGIETYHTASEPFGASAGGENKVKVPVIYHGIEGKFDVDEQNRTAFRINRFSGNFKMSVLYNTNVVGSYVIQDSSFNDVTLTTNYWFQIGQITDFNKPGFSDSNRLIFAQLNKDMANIMTDDSKSNNTLSVRDYTYDPNAEFHEMEYIFDTDKSTITVTVDGLKTGTGEFSIPLDYINSISLTGWHRAQKGTYFNLKNIKVEYLQENPALNEAVAKLNELKPSLVNDPCAVTENITLPVAENITWSSSNEEVASIDGTTAIVNRWYEDREVILTATYEKDGTVLMKDYTLTVKADENLVTDELLNIIVSENDSTADWIETYGAGNPAGALSVSANGLSVTKVTVAEEDTPEAESPEYVVERKLYAEEIPYSDSNYSALYSSGFSGLYSFGFTLKSNVTGSVPIKVGIGGYDGVNYANSFDIAVTKDSIHALYDGETLVKSTRLYRGDTVGKTFEFKFVVDTINERFWAYVDGELVAADVVFYDKSSFYKFDTLRIVVDKNNSLNDSITINNLKLEELEENVIADKDNLISIIKSLSVKDITNDSPAEVGSIKTLPESVENVPVKWVCNSDALNFETGKVVFDTDSKDVLVSAYLTANGVEVRKDFYLTIRAAANTDETLDFITQRLDAAITSQNAGDIRYDIYLPQSYDNMNITWESSDTSVIGVDGAINRNTAITSPKPVKLTANIEYKGKNYTKVYNFTVSPTSGKNTVYTGSNVPEKITVNGVENVVLTNTSHTYLKLSQTDCNDGVITFTDENGNAILKLMVLNNTYYFDYEGSDYKSYSMPAGKTVDFEVVLIPEINKLAVWADGVRIVDYADFMNSADNYAGITVTGTGLTFEKTEITVDDYGVLDINIDNIDYFENLSKRVLKNSVSFENRVVMPATVEWKSSNTSLVTDSGVVTIPDAYDFVTMTLTMYDENNESIYRKISLDVAVACDKGKNLIPGKTIKGSAPEITGHKIENISDENFDTSFALLNANKQSKITVDLGNEIYVNAVYLNEDFSSYASGIKKFSVAYSNDGNTWTDLKTVEVNNTASNYVTFDMTKMRYILITVLESDEKTVYINELEAYFVASPDEIIKYDIDSVELNLGSVVTENITLPQAGPQGTQFKWTSSNPSVISTTGVVTRPEKGTNVTLTVSASYNGTSYTKKFNAYVSGVGSTGGAIIGGSASGGGAGGGAGGGNKTTDSTVPGFVETEQDDTETSDITNTVITFKDVPETHWAFDTINTLKELGIVDGDGAGSFNPSSVVTREQFIKMLVEASDIELTDKEAQFKDVDSTMWYAPYIQTGVYSGLINGLSSVEFGVGKEIKRCDMAVMLYRIMKNMDVEIGTDKVLFADDESIPQYASKAVYAVRSAGIIEGYNNMFNPNESLTRAEAATVLMKFLELKR